jgi:hypothetical protein
MKYRWTECPQCRCEVVVNYSDEGGGVTGSLRRWSRDRSTNDGKPIKVAADSRAADGSFPVTCVCGQELAVPSVPDAVGAERDRS